MEVGANGQALDLAPKHAAAEQGQEHAPAPTLLQPTEAVRALGIPATVNHATPRPAQVRQVLNNNLKVLGGHDIKLSIF